LMLISKIFVKVLQDVHLVHMFSIVELKYVHKNHGSFKMLSCEPINSTPLCM